ncbi:MAG: tetratricopeptide repeat protein [Bacteroidetes bacterium]|nr:tetratricopeptide repeat protein [Bacteroidota bacterium]
MKSILNSIHFSIALLITIHSFGQQNIDSLKHIIDSSSDEVQLMQTYNDYAFLFVRSNPDTAIFYAEKALALAEKLDNTIEKYSAYNGMGLSYHTKGLYKLSIDNYNKALQIEKIKDQDRAKLYHNIALSYRSESKNTDALNYELKAINIMEDKQDSLVLGVVYQSLCNIYRDLGDFKKGEEYILKSIAIYQNMKSEGMDNLKAFLANSYSGYGNLLQMSGRLNEAVEMHKKAIDLHDESGDMYNQAIAYENLGDDYLILKKYDLSIASFNQAKKRMAELNSATGVGYELLNIASVYKETGMYSNALQNLDSALQIFTEISVDNYRLNVYQLQYQIYDEMHDAESALAAYKQYNNLKDSLNSIDQTNELLRLKEEFETTQKEQQIVLLETENTLKDKEKNDQIVLRNIAIGVIALLLVFGLLLRNRYRIKQQVKQLKMRNEIAIDLHDEVGSSLSSIKMLSEIASTQHNNENYLNELLSKININAKETAEKMHDIIWMINPRNDQMENILQRMEKFLFEMCTARNILFEFQNNMSDDIELTMIQRKDILLIFKEAVNNAVKYAEAKQIIVTINHTQHQLLLFITDDGKGFDINTIQPGNGLDSMQMRAKELNGLLSIKSQLNHGTEISLNVPM